jgi:hypothetical protein
MTESTTNTLYCYVHPNRETSLRCNNCDRPICASCAVRMPTGYRCRECVKGHQQIFNTAEWYDYIIGFVAAAFLSGIASFLVTLVGGIGFFGWFLIAIGSPTAGRSSPRRCVTHCANAAHAACSSRSLWESWSARCRPS